MWWDRHIEGGAQFSKEIEKALQGAHAVVVLWSKRSVESAWVCDEAAAGRDSGRLVPVTIDRSPPPLGFRQYQTIDVSGAKLRSGSVAIRALLDAIEDLAQTGSGQGNAMFVPASGGSLTSAPRLSRRAVAAGLAATAALGAGAFILLHDSEPSTPPQLQALLAQAWQAWSQATSEGNSQAIGLYRRATELAPEHADSWGFLGCAYADRAQAWAPASEQPALRERAREAGRRALQLDPKNAYGRAALAYAQPVRGNWLVMEREFQQALDDQPGKWLLTYSLALLFTHVGRLSDSAALFAQLKGNAPTVTQYYFHISSLWGSGRLGEAERLLDEASAIYSSHPSIWITRFDLLTFGGRPEAAIALAQDTSARPAGLHEEWLERRLAVARALLSRKPEDSEKVTGELYREARISSERASRAIEELSALGRLDEAFALADAFYFSSGFAIPDEPVTDGQTASVTLAGRGTALLFLPPAQPMRRDPRFQALVQKLGLVSYWRAAGAQPDYRRT